MKKFKQFFAEKTVLGLIEFFDVDGVGKIPSKLDSGNGAFNVIHGEDIQVQGNKVMFKTVNNKHLMKDIIEEFANTRFGKFKTSVKTGKDFGNLKELF